MMVTRTTMLSVVAAALSAGSFLFAGECMSADNHDSAKQMVSATMVEYARAC